MSAPPRIPPAPTGVLADAAAASLLLAAPMHIEARLVASGARRAHVHRTGMGPAKAIAAAAALPALPGGALLVVGFCGALHNSLQPGEVVLADEVYVAEDEGHAPSRVACAGVGALGDALSERGFAVTKAPIVCVGRLALGERRQELLRSGAVAVDMESAWLAPGAAQRPFAVVRIVLDTPEKELLRPQMVPVALRACATLRRVAKTLDAIAHQHGLHTLFGVGTVRAGAQQATGGDQAAGGESDRAPGDESEV